jgi:hypothetical protein
VVYLNTDLDETYFGNFDLERVCIDKVFFLVYDEQYVQEQHFFDKDLRDRFIHNVKRSRIKKGKFEQVLRKSNDFSAWELRLAGTRAMYFHVNVIHYLQHIHDIKPSHIIYDDNFMPPDSNLTVLDYVASLRQFIQEAQQFYKDTVKKYWNEDLQNINFKIVQIEIPFEVYPASVDDIAQKLYAKGVSFRKYNTQSATLYLTNDKWDNEVTRPERKHDKIDQVDDADLSPSPTPDIVYLNQINSGRSENKIQCKIYQKTFGLCRIEFTAYSIDAKSIFNFKAPDNFIAQVLIDFVHYNLKNHDILVDRYDRSLDDVVQFLAKILKEPEDLIYTLKDTDIFEACRSNMAVRKRLVRKGVLLKKYDDDGTQQRGVYLVNPLIRDFLNLYKENGKEHFVKSSLYPSL